MLNIPSSDSLHIAHGLLKPRILYVSDMDGTLLNSESRVSTASATMLNRAIAQGTLFSVATARTPATVTDLLADIDMRLPGIVMTGAAMFDVKQLKYSHIRCISSEVVTSLVQKYKKHDVPVFIYTISGDHILHCYHIGALNKLEKEFIDQRSGTPFKHFHIPLSGESVLPDPIGNVILMFSLQPWKKAYPLYEEIKADTQIPCYPLCYHDAFGDEWGELEIFSRDAGKAAAVETLASDTGAGRIIAFGDNVNDISLFEIADEKIAVEGAIDTLKQLATDIIGSNDRDAVPEFILRHSR